MDELTKEGQVGPSGLNEIEAKDHQVVFFDRGEEGIRIAISGLVKPSLVLFAGEPIGQPVARYGPFVMNSTEELVQAVDDCRQSLMGIVASRPRCLGGIHKIRPIY